MVVGDHFGSYRRGGTRRRAGEPVEEKEWSEEDFMVSFGDAEENVEDEPLGKED
jgi:hypothetical protein